MTPLLNVLQERFDSVDASIGQTHLDAMDLITAAGGDAPLPFPHGDDRLN